MQQNLQQVVFDAIERVLNTPENPTFLSLPVKSYMASEVSDAVKGWSGVLDSDNVTLDVIADSDKPQSEPLDLQIRSIISDTLEVSGEGLDYQTVDALVAKIRFMIEGHR